MSKKAKKPVLIFEYSKSPEYREHYVTGARGGFQNGYHLHLEFYREKRKLTKTQHMIDVSEGERKIVDVDAVETPIIEREFVVGVDLSFHAARELTSWLVKRMDELEKLEKELAKIGNETEDSETK